MGIGFGMVMDSIRTTTKCIAMEVAEFLVSFAT